MSARLAVAVASAVAIGARVLPAQAPTVKNAVGMEFVLISPGSMLVGRFQPECPRPGSRATWTPDDYARCEQMAKRDATSGFTVTISRPYHIGKFEVTQGEWKRVMGTNPSVFKGARVKGDADRYPVDNVTWSDAQAFVRKLNAMDPSARYRLPSEFEWEYAARAVATEEPSWESIRASAWEQEVDLGTTHPVGGKKPNAWGLHDMLGNVWEWVSDFYNGKLFADPVPPNAGATHVLKAGSFVSDVKNATWTTHGGGPGSGFDVGFRVVRERRRLAPGAWLFQSSLG